METFSALLAFCAGNSPVTGEFSAQRPVTRSFDVFFDLCLNQKLSKQWIRRWFETLSCSSWRHCNVYTNDEQGIRQPRKAFLLTETFVNMIQLRNETFEWHHMNTTAFQIISNSNVQNVVQANNKK